MQFWFVVSSQYFPIFGTVQGCFKDQFRTERGLIGSHGEREPITGVWGGALIGRLGGRAPGGVRGQSPLKLKAFLHFACPKEATNLPHDWMIFDHKVIKSHSERTIHCLTTCLQRV